MTPTTPSTLRALFRTAIEGITPSYAEYQSETWHYVPKPDEVPGPRIRNFTILASPSVAEDPDDAVQGGGFSRSYEMEVMASYSHLPMVEDESIIDEDAMDLYLALLDVSDTGFISVSYPEWVTDSEAEEGHVWGSYAMEVRFFGRNS